MITLFHGEDITSSRNALPKGGVDEPLFTSRRVVILENPKTLPKSLDVDTDIFLWFDHKLTPSQLQQYPGAKITEFKLGQIVFQFLESIRPGNQKIMLPLFEKYCQQELPEITFVMIVRQFRLMLNPAGLPTWQKNRVLAQAKKFSPEKIREIYKKLLAIDYELKSGQSVSDLKGSLELFLLTL